jgi:hypothetical protein
MNNKMSRILFFIFIIGLGSKAFAQVEFNSKTLRIPPLKVKPKKEDVPQTKVSKFDVPKIVAPNIFKETNIFGTKPKPNNSFQMGIPENLFSLTPKKIFTHQLGDVFQNKMTKDLDKTMVREGLKEDDSFLDRTNRYLGDFKTKSNFLVVKYRDYIHIDGDLFNVYLNDKLIQSQLFLDFQFSEFKIPLSIGVNKIEFVVASQGTSGGNTAEIHAIDNVGKAITDEYWDNLALGTKIKLIIVRE